MYKDLYCYTKGNDDEKLTPNIIDNNKTKEIDYEQNDGEMYLKNDKNEIN